MASSSEFGHLQDSNELLLSQKSELGLGAYEPNLASSPWLLATAGSRTYSLAEKNAKCLDQQVNNQQSNSSHCLICAQAVRHKFIVMHTASVISLVQAEHVCIPLAYVNYFSEWIVQHDTTL